MEYISKLEHTIEGWFKNAPHLPETVRKWIGTNIWWIVGIAAALNVIAVLVFLTAIFGAFETLAGSSIAYYASTTTVTMLIVKSIIALLFSAVECVLLFMAISPLRMKQKKGWTLIFIVFLLNVVSTVIGAFVTPSIFSFISNIIFGALWVAIGAYFLFEIRSQFAHVERSKGVKKRS